MSAALVASERAVLASVIEANGDELPPMLARLLQHAPEAWSDARHGAIAAAVRRLRTESRAVTPGILLPLLADDRTGASLLLGSLPDAALSLDLAETEAGSVWSAYQTRRTRQLLGEALTEIDRQPDLAGTIASLAAKALAELGGNGVAKSAEARPIGSLVAPLRDDGTELLANRYICRGAGALLVGQSGQGKSSLAVQMAIEWSLNRHCFGIRPIRPLRVLLIQSENDDGDLYEMFGGVCTGLQLSDLDRKLAGERIVFFHEDSRAGEDFLKLTVEPLVRKHQPDLIILDPALAYVGGDTKDAEAVGKFLRRGLNPILHRYGCAVLIIHHTTKAKTDGPQFTHDFLYAGSGSIEFTNWARAVLVLETRGNGCYRLHAPKRGARIGWVNADKQPVFDTFIRHSRTPGAICWEAIDEAEVQTTIKVGKNKADLLAHVPVQGSIPQTVLLEKASAAGIGQKKSRAFLDDLLAEGTLSLWLEKRKGTNPAKLISRHPQPEPQLSNL